MKRRPLIFLIATVAGVIFLLLYLISPREEKGGKPAVPQISQAEVTRRYLELEAAALRQDQTTWSQEMRALEHERVLVDLWDEMRNTERPWDLFSRFQFGRMLLPKPPASSNLLSHNIVQRKYGPGDQEYGRATVQAMLRDWQQGDWEIEQMELRQPRFSEEGGFGRSIIDFHFHAIQAKSNRMIVRGSALIRWKREGHGPFPEEIKIQSMEVLEQKGPLAFRPVLSEVLPPVPGLENLDPYLLAYDFDGDELPELGLATHNALLRNKKGKFEVDRLCAFPRPFTHAAILGEFTGDGQVDLLVADLEGAWLYSGDSAGKFNQKPLLAWKPAEPLFNPFVLTTGDIDGDGDQDVWLAQYKLPYVEGQMPTPYYDANDGFPSYLLVNNGRGTFTDKTEEAGLGKKRFRRTYSNSFFDLDRDGDLDLVVVSDFAGIDIHLNNGKGIFSDATPELISNPHAFGMAHSFADVNQDGSWDILMIGMDSAVADRLHNLGLGRLDFPEHDRKRPLMAWGNRLYLRSGERFLETELSHSVAKAGWAWGVSLFDFDNDGDLDAYIVNGHNSRLSAMDYETQFWRHDIYVGNSDSKPEIDLFFRGMAQKLYGAGLSYGGYHKNKFFLNEGGTNYVEVAHLLGLAIEEDCRNLLSEDVDGDGRLDLIFTTFQQWPSRRQGVHIFKNHAPAGESAKVRVQMPAAGTEVELTMEGGGGMLRAVVTGDSYRSQNSQVLHFGLGQGKAVRGIVQRPGKRPEVWEPSRKDK